ncbi:hypothetical protein BcDW1_3394 [Botrytis cinerea BcDW1]|uniref:Uncharacterized protein n=2 Tax=Botryotinia fuckeliana TaxID=40559 RepID=G2Y0K4_BOTF4|nr:hypothetical protein BcDW1_3394 [Botrytis cinerea BcDW1]CCD46169.1 hypothetical protein BofuT4_P117190.1 [Botrytis cinerea T4]
MLFSKRLSKTPDQLELHKAALLYHKQKHAFRPMQQVQKSPIHLPEESIRQKVSVSSDSPISIGNVFQDGMSSLPVMHLPEHHLVRLRKSRTQKSDDVSHKTSIHTSNLFRARVLKPKIRIFSNRHSKEPPKTTTEEKTNTCIKAAAEAAIKTKPTRLVLTPDSKWSLSLPKNASTCNLALGASAEQNHDYSENTITVEKDHTDEDGCHDLHSKEINESVAEEKLELDIRPSETSKVGLYQGWKRRILERSGAKEVH